MSEFMKAVVVPVLLGHQPTPGLMNVDNPLGRESLLYVVLDGSVKSEWWQFGPRILVRQLQGRQGPGVALREGLLRALEDGADIIGQYDVGQSVSTALHLLGVAEDVMGQGHRSLLVLGQRDFATNPRPRWRNHLSRAATALVNQLLPAERRQGDATCGMRVWDRQALEAIPWHKVRSRGYAFNAELLYWALMKVDPLMVYAMRVVDKPANRSALRPRDIVRAGWDYMKLLRRETKIC